jgi:hypothetical protein
MTFIIKEFYDKLGRRNTKRMKNKIQIYSIVVISLYFIPKLLKIKGLTESIGYGSICFTAILSLGIFELKRLILFDKLNNTNKFMQRILLILAALIVFIVVTFIL